MTGGDAQWLAPFRVPLDVVHFGRIDVNLEGFVQECERIIFEGPFTIHIEQIEPDN